MENPSALSTDGPSSLGHQNITQTQNTTVLPVAQQELSNNQSNLISNLLEDDDVFQCGKLVMKL